MTSKFRCFMREYGAFLIVSLGLLVSVLSDASTRVGNGDEGADLEGAEPIAASPVESPFSKARAKAVERLRQVNTAGIAGLGTLLPEVETAALYLSRKDVNAALAGEQGSFHSDMRGQVFARTFPQPHAPTRFFPIAGRLSEEQLIALNIHEGLHRALPPGVREDESVVSAVTLAITSPEASHDRIQEVMARLANSSGPAAANGAAPEPGAGTPSRFKTESIPEDERILQPSNVGYTYRQFQSPRQPMIYPVDHIHTLHSFLYPFGSDRVPMGVGIEASLIGRPDSSQMGPLALSPRMRLWSSRGFDVGAWASASLNTLSAEELRNSLFGRDVFALGLSLRKNLKSLYFENLLGLSFGSAATQTIGSSTYRYEFGNVVNATVRAGLQIWKFQLGAFGELLLADYFRVINPAYNFDSGRYRLLSGGPELRYAEKDFSVELSGRFLLDATQGASYDYLGNLLGQGTSQGSAAITASYYF